MVSLARWGVWCWGLAVHQRRSERRPRGAWGGRWGCTPAAVSTGQWLREACAAGTPVNQSINQTAQRTESAKQPTQVITCPRRRINMFISNLTLSYNLAVIQLIASAIKCSQSTWEYQYLQVITEFIKGCWTEHTPDLLQYCPSVHPHI